MKATEQFFHVVLLLCCTKSVLTFTSVDQTLVTIQMKAIEQLFHVVLFIMLHKMLLTFKSASESYRVIL